MASGWNLWVWLECIGVVSGCCCIRRYIDILIIIITFPYSTCICSFLAAASLFLCPFLKCFLVLLIYRIGGSLFYGMKQFWHIISPNGHC